jgi:hypothetical protein
MTTRHHTHPRRTGELPGPDRAPDVIHASAVLAEQLRRATGYRVDGPEGRIGTLRALVPGDLGADPLMRVDVGLFIRNEVGIPLADVHRVDGGRRRVLVSSVPRMPRRAGAAPPGASAGSCTRRPPDRQTTA